MKKILFIMWLILLGYFIFDAVYTILATKEILFTNKIAREFVLDKINIVVLIIVVLSQYKFIAWLDKRLLKAWNLNDKAKYIIEQQDKTIKKYIEEMKAESQDDEDDKNKFNA